MRVAHHGRSCAWQAPLGAIVLLGAYLALRLAVGVFYFKSCPEGLQELRVVSEAAALSAWVNHS